MVAYILKLSRKNLLLIYVPLRLSILRKESYPFCKKNKNKEKMATLIVLHLKRLRGPLIYEQKLKIDHLLRGLQNNQQQNIKYAGRKSFQKIDMMFSLFESIHAIFFPESLTNKLKIICSFCDDSIGIFVLRSIFFWGRVILDDYSSLLLISKAYLFILTILCSSDKDVKS